MTELKKYKLIQTLITFGYLACLLLVGYLGKKQIIGDTILIIVFVVITVAILPYMLYVDKKVNKLKKEEFEESLKKEKEEMKRKLFERSQVSDIVNTMYELYSGNCSQLNELLEKHNLSMEYLYDEDENSDWFYIESNYDKNLKDIYILELSGEGKISLGKDESFDVSNMSYEEIVQYIVNDINKFYSEN